MSGSRDFLPRPTSVQHANTFTMCYLYCAIFIPVGSSVLSSKLHVAANGRLFCLANNALLQPSIMPGDLYEPNASAPSISTAASVPHLAKADNGLYYCFKMYANFVRTMRLISATQLRLLVWNFSGTKVRRSMLRATIPNLYILSYLFELHSPISVICVIS